MWRSFLRNYTFSHSVYMILYNQVTLWHPTYMLQPQIYMHQRDVMRRSIKRYSVTPFTHDSPCIHDSTQSSHTLTPCIHATAAHVRAPALCDAVFYKTTRSHTLCTWFYTIKSHSDTLHTCHSRISTCTSGTWCGAWGWALMHLQHTVTR